MDIESYKVIFYPNIPIVAMVIVTINVFMSLVSFISIYQLNVE